MTFKDFLSRQTLTHNLGLKLISLAVAIIMWVIVVNINDPVVSQQYKNVPVKVINEDVITNDGKTVEVVEDTDVLATVTLKAPRSVIRELGNTTDNIVAVADLENLSQDGTSVPIELSTTKYTDKIDSIKSSSDTLKVSIENRKDIQLPITAVTTGDIESGYILGDIKTAQNQVRISGPESIVSVISAATVEIPVTGFIEDISSVAEIKLSDIDGNEISKKNLTLNVNEVTVDVEILATKRVPIYYSTMGNAQDGYGVTGEIECDPETVVIAGEEAVIEGITEITVPSSELNITGQSEDLSVIIDLKNYLPTGVRFGDSSFNGKASITVFIEPYEEESYGINVKNIEINNVPEGFTAAFAEKNAVIEFTLYGLRQTLEKLQISSIDFSVDFDDYTLLNNVTKYKEGTYDLDIVLELPDGIECDDVIKVPVTLTKEK